MGDASDVVASLDLLCDQRFCGSHEDNFAGGEPTVVVVHDDGGNESFTETSGETHKDVVEECRLDNVSLVVAHWEVGGIHPGGTRFAVKRRCRCVVVMDYRAKFATWH